MISRYLVDFKLSELKSRETDCLIVGAGIAGLYTAIKLSEKLRVTMVIKKGVFESNTRHAQGGIAAVISETDSPNLHRQDTLIAGAGLCDSKAVDVLVNEGTQGIYDLIRLGTEFDKEGGEIALTREGAHSERRILHAHGDATGAEIVRALVEQARKNPNITILEDHFAIDVVTKENEAIGLIVLTPQGEQIFIKAKATILSTGGVGQLYRYTTNPEIATGDGIAMAYRAGALIKDVEFIQFHPTVLNYPGAPRFLISEAVRGEGAVLRNINGERFMQKYHPQLELAPRDIVSRAIVTEMEETKASFIYLDITHEPREKLKSRFPTIYEYCIQYGLDLATDWIPVAPAAHYMMGGVKVNLNGETTISRLFANGETSCTGVHGANRLASNSLSEAVVIGARIAQRVVDLPPIPEFQNEEIQYTINRKEPMNQHVIEKRLKLQKLMLRYVGIKRNERELTKALHELQRHISDYNYKLAKKEEFEYINLLTVGLLTTLAALRREESRGGHFREDFPERDDIVWRKHLILHKDKGIMEESIE